MKQSLKWISKYTDLPLDNKEKLNEIVDRIALQIVDVDEREILLGEGIIDIDNKIITNRPYAFGHRGMAREMAVMLDQQYHNEYHTLPSQTENLPISVEVMNPELCARFTAVSIKDIKIGPSPAWLKEAVESIGQRSINNLVDLTNYIMFDTAQPVHAYDYQKVAGNKIIVRRAKEGEKIVTLDGVERNLNPEVLLICDTEKPIGIGGVMGGGCSEIDDNTTDIILEVASFHPINIRQTARALRHRTDAVQRFEKGPDPLNIINVLQELAYLVIETCGGQIASKNVDIDNLDKSTLRVKPYNLEFNLNYVERLLGFKVSDEFIQRVLNGFDIKILEKKENLWSLEIPTLRPDIKEPSDIIEEIGRMYGYQNIPNRSPINRLTPPKRNLKLECTRKIKSAMLSSGLDEVITYSFISQKDIDAFGLKNPITLINPLSQDYLYLRPTLIPSLMKVVGTNVKYFDSFGLFEISRKFLRKKGEVKKYEEDHGESLQPDEVQVVSAVYYDKALKNQSIFILKGAVINMFEGILSKEAQQSTKFEINGDIFLGNTLLGKIGLVGKAGLGLNDVEYPVAYVELDLATLVQNYDSKREYKPFSKQQGTRIDYSVLIDKDLPVNRVFEVIPEHEWIVSKEIIDVYKDIKDQPAKKSVSVRIYMQKMDGTITSSESYDLGKAIESKLLEIPNLEIRGGGASKPTDYNSSESNSKNSEVKQESTLPTSPLKEVPQAEDVLGDSKDTIVIGKILEIEKHSNADKLVICKIDVGPAQPEGVMNPDHLQIVTGAENIKPGIAEGKYVPVALPGAQVMSYKTGEMFTIGIGNLRGEVSEGMLCAKKELGIEDEVGGIWILEDSEYQDKVGQNFNYQQFQTNTPVVKPAQELLTEQLYLTDSYLKNMDAKIIEVKEETQGQYRIILDKTVFYPMGGGQGTDQGKLSSNDWNAEVFQVMMKDGQIWHYIKSQIAPKVGDEVKGEINWDRRYKNMKLHSAGHIVDFAMYLLGYSPSPLLPYKGDHNKDPHIVYKGMIDKDSEALALELKSKSDELIQKGLKLNTEVLPLEEIQKEAIYLQPGLPSNKPLRILRLEGVGAVADGGTQVSDTNEISGIEVKIEVIGDETIVRYNLGNF
jgi:phenylalanyl-tRNA synthetase beta chain